MSAALVKLAGEINESRIRQLAGISRPGDIVNFKTRLEDAARRSIRDGLMTAGISRPISRATKSPYSHTALIDSIDPDGTINLIHNYEQSGKSGITKAKLRDFANATSFHISRPKLVSEKVARDAIEHARKAMKTAKYSKADLISMGPQEIIKARFKPGGAVSNTASRLTQALARRHRGASCDPATGVCSYLPLYAYGKALGGDERRAAELLGAPAYFKETTFSPGDYIRAAEQGLLHTVGTYEPMNPEKNLRGALRSRAKDKLILGIRDFAKKFA